ncbi:MAG: hypothetical protein ABSB49_15715 [Polyangia bacterium]|jgi:hypothetical protein
MARLPGVRLAAVAALSAAGLANCHWTPPNTVGATAVIAVGGGQAVRGSIAAPGSTSAATAIVTPINATIYAGVVDKVLNGVVASNNGPDANMVGIGVAGDVAYWQVPALEPDISSPGSFDYTASLSIAREIWSSPLIYPSRAGDGTYTLPLSVRAIDSAGNFGPASIQPLILDPVTLGGTLVVTLQWDTPTNLDLHVLVPTPGTTTGYVDVWAGHRAAFSGNPDAGLPADGILDVDSNANCQIDGRDVENVTWQGTPPSGHYIVRVGVGSLCGQTSAAWWASASVAGGSMAGMGQASGILTEAAERTPETSGSGVTAFEFDYP